MQKKLFFAKFSWNFRAGDPLWNYLVGARRVGGKKEIKNHIFFFYASRVCLMKSPRNDIYRDGPPDTRKKVLRPTRAE